MWESLNKADKKRADNISGVRWTYLDVVDDEDVLEVVRRDDHEEERGEKGEDGPVVDGRVEEVEQEPEALKAEQNGPVAGGGVELLRADLLGEEVKDVGEVPLEGADGDGEHGEGRLDTVVRLMLKPRVEADERVSDGAVVVGPELVRGQVVRHGVLVGPDLGRAADQIHHLYIAHPLRRNNDRKHKIQVRQCGMMKILELEKTTCEMQHWQAYLPYYKRSHKFTVQVPRCSSDDKHTVKNTQVAIM